MPAALKRLYPLSFEILIGLFIRRTECRDSTDRRAADNGRTDGRNKLTEAIKNLGSGSLATRIRLHIPASILQLFANRVVCFIQRFVGIWKHNAEDIDRWRHVCGECRIADQAFTESDGRLCKAESTFRHAAHRRSN